MLDLLGFLWDTQETGENSIAPSILLDDATLGSLESFQKPNLFVLSLDFQLELLRNIASGLAALHEVGIVYGDLKIS